MGMTTLPESCFSRKYFDNPIAINFTSQALENKNEQWHQTNNSQLCSYSKGIVLRGRSTTMQSFPIFTFPQTVMVQWKDEKTSWRQPVLNVVWYSKHIHWMVGRWSVFSTLQSSQISAGFFSICAPWNIYRNTKVAYLEQFAVATEWRGSGLSARILHRAEDMARRWGLRILTLHVQRDDWGPLRFYQKHGFEITSDWMGRGPQRFLLMKLL